MKLPRAILFDHDGVLVASEPLHWAAWEQLLQELKVPYDIREIQIQVGRTAPQILTEILDRHIPGWSPAKFDVDALALRKNDYYLRMTQAQLRLYPGVKEGLEWLKAMGIARVVVSNAKRRELEAALKQLGIFDLFDAIVSRDDIQPPKPDPSPYLYGAASVGVQPAQCIAVEDSPPGLEAALLAKIPTAAVMTNFPHEVVEAPVPGRPSLRPVWIGRTIEDFFEWLKTLVQQEPNQ